VFLGAGHVYSTCFHTHTLAASTWSNAGHVEKNAYPTPKQKKKTIVKAERKHPLKPSCGTPQTATPTQREKPI
jgi:hypothetical protein